MDLKNLIDWNKSCPVIRAYVQVTQSNVLAGCPVGYLRYWKKMQAGYGDWNASDVPLERNQSYEICWIRQNNLISVPWGLGGEGKPKIHGQILFQLNGIKNIEKFLMKFPVIWERKTVGTSFIEYLNEYFIDQEDQQSGISIKLREMILSEYRDRIIRYVEQNEGMDADAFLKGSIGTSFEQYGLTVAQNRGEVSGNG